MSSFTEPEWDSNEFGNYFTESIISYEDNGKEIVITSKWEELPINCEIYEDRIKYLFRLTSRLSFFSEIQKEIIDKKVKEIPEDRLKEAAIKINPPSYRVAEWMYKMENMGLNKKINGDILFGGLINILNKFIPYDGIIFDDTKIGNL